MTGPPPAHRRLRHRPATIAGALVAMISLNGCGHIDKSQWRPLPTLGARDTADTGTRSTGNTTSGSRSGSGSGSRSGSGSGNTVNANDPNGVVAGAVGGGVRQNSAAFTVATTTATCWVLVVDGKSSRGCGNATITDTRGNRAGRVTKTSGTAAITLTLWAGQKALKKGEVRSVGHYVTVSG